MSQRVHPPSSLLGSQLASRYEIRALIGRGGMGEVYEAVDHQLDRTVAVKVLRPELAADRRFLARFRREARTAARLSHPGIVGVHDIGGRAFIVMEFVPGRTLGTIVRDDGGADPSQAARIGAAVADALAHAHDRGVVHRDIAPGNIMVTPSGTVKVLDFGIARAARGSARSGSPSAHGTAAYVAPEQARGEASDQRADVYALGAVLYEFLAGRPPFTADTTVELVQRSALRAPPPLRSLRPDVPAALERVIDRCLAKDPVDRYVQAEELARALRDAAPARTARTALAVPASRLDPTATAPIVRASTAVLPPATTARAPAPRRRRTRHLMLWTAAGLLLFGGAWVVVPAISAMSTGTIHPHVRGPKPVPAPTALTASTSCNGLFSTRADLAWTPGGPSKGYEIWRKEPGMRTYVLVTRIRDWHATSFSDTGLGIDQTYRYVVRAMAGARVSAPSGEAQAPTPLLCLA